MRNSPEGEKDVVIQEQRKREQVKNTYHKLWGILETEKNLSMNEAWKASYRIAQKKRSSYAKLLL